MTDKTYVDNVTLTDADSFNDFNRLHYTILGDPATAAAALGFAGIKDVVNFRLTLTTVTPVTTADVTGATTIYCSPYKGNQIALYDGTNWVVRTSAEFSLALGTLTSALPYDVFCYDNSGTPTLEFLAWTNTTTRATALALQNGILSKTGALTRRYLGTFITTSTTATEDSLANRYLWNYYNRVLRHGRGTFSANRTTTSATYVELNTEIRCNFVIGVSEDAVFAAANGTASVSTASNSHNTAISFDSTTVAQAGFESAGIINITDGAQNLHISGFVPPANMAIGAHFATLLGAVNAGLTLTYYTASVIGNAAAKAKAYLNIGVWG